MDEELTASEVAEKLTIKVESWYGPLDKEPPFYCEGCSEMHYGITAITIPFIEIVDAPGRQAHYDQIHLCVDCVKEMVGQIVAQKLSDV